MSYRHSARYGASLENEQRRLQREPVAVWKQQWVVPAGAPQSSGHGPVKILKWVKTADTVRFDEDDAMNAGAVGDETMMSITAPTEQQVDAPVLSSSASVMDMSAAHTPAAAEQSTSSGLAAAEAQDAGLPLPSSSLSSIVDPSSSVEARQGTGPVAEAAIAAEDSQLLTQSSLPTSDPLDRPSTQDDLSSSLAMGSSAPLASTSIAEPADLQATQESATAITLDAPSGVDESVAAAPMEAAGPNASQSNDAAEAAMAEQAEAEAQQGGTGDGSLPAQEFLPDSSNP